MRRSVRFMNNSIILAFKHLIINLLSIFIVGYMARIFGQSDYGIFSLSLTFPAVFAVFFNFGQRTLMIREIAKGRENALSCLNSYIPIRIVLMLSMLLVIIFFARVVNYDLKTLQILSIGALISFIEHVSRIFQDVFQAFEEMTQISIRDVCVRVITGLSSVLLLYYGYGLYEVMWAYVVGALCGLLINLVLFMRRFHWDVCFYLDCKTLLTHIKDGFSFMLIGFGTILYVKTDVIMLSIIETNNSVGVYNAAANLIYRMGFISDSVATATFPVIAQLFWINRDRANSIINKSIILLLVISLPMAAGGFLTADLIINTIYGKGYVQSISVFQILIVTIPFGFIAMLFNYSLGAINEQEYVLKGVLFFVVLNIALNFIFIDYFSVMGASIATLITQVFAAIYFGYKMVQIFHLKEAATFLISTFVVTGVMCISVIVVKHYCGYMSIPAGMIVYALLTLLILKKKGLDFGALAHSIGKI